MGGTASDRAGSAGSLAASGHRHLPAAGQPAALSRKLRGRYAYYGITGNARSFLEVAYGLPA